jgi:hypothetical protein
LQSGQKTGIDPRRWDLSSGRGWNRMPRSSGYGLLWSCMPRAIRNGIPNGYATQRLGSTGDVRSRCLHSRQWAYHIVAPSLIEEPAPATGTTPGPARVSGSLHPDADEKPRWRCDSPSGRMGLGATSPRPSPLSLSPRIGDVNMWLSHLCPMPFFWPHHGRGDGSGVSLGGRQFSELDHFKAALTIATMPALIASGSSGQAVTTAAKALRGDQEPGGFPSMSPRGETLRVLCLPPAWSRSLESQNS